MKKSATSAFLKQMGRYELKAGGREERTGKESVDEICQPTLTLSPRLIP